MTSKVVAMSDLRWLRVATENGNEVRDECSQCSHCISTHVHPLTTFMNGHLEDV